MLSRVRRDLPLWRRALRRRRRALTLLACALAVVALLPVVLEASAEDTSALVARTDLPAGTVLAPEHLRTVALSDSLLPAGVPTEAEALLGRRVVRPLPAGTPLLPAVLEDPGAPAIPSGQAVMAVPVPEVLLPHLAPGTAIELLPTVPVPSAAASVGGQQLAEHSSAMPSAIPARVVTVPAGPAGAEGPVAPAATAVEVLVTVEVTRSRDVAHALVSGGVVVAVIGYSPDGPALADPPPHDS